MLKKILIPITALLAVLALASPASATVSDAANCNYDNPDIAKASGSLSVRDLGGGQLEITGIVNDTLANRGWDWTMFHDGDVSYSGSDNGDFTKVRSMVNLPGSDTIKWQFKNNARTVTCNATVTWFASP